MGSRLLNGDDAVAVLSTAIKTDDHRAAEAGDADYAGPAEAMVH